MTSFHRRQRGEGKVGCIVSLLVLVIAVAVAIKAVPIYWSDNQLKDAAKDLATRASSMPTEAITLQLRAKAKDLDIAEAVAPGAIIAVKSSTSLQGTCTIQLRYKRDIDLYGAYTWSVIVDTTVSAPYMTGL